MRRTWLRLLLTIFAWVAIGLIFAWQLRLLALINGMQMKWSNIIGWELTRWCLWIFLYPIVLRTIRRTSERSGTGRRFFLTNAAASILVSLLHLALFSIVYWCGIRFGEALALPVPFLEKLRQLPEVFAKAAFDPHKLFTMIFSVDFHIGILIYWIILAGRLAIEYSHRAADLKTQLAQAQLEALKMQLHPHFLFNTLNSISALVHKDPEAADEMIGELGNFLRLTLQNHAGAEVTLEQELRFLTSYLEIERIRFQDRLAVQMEIDPDTLQALVPNLILQPIIENAIRHGIARRSGSGRIEVRSRQIDARLRLEILDDGPGLSRQHTEGIGLSNVRERLKALYGSDWEFRISTRVEGGACVEIGIPFRVEGSS